MSQHLPEGMKKNQNKNYRLPVSGLRFKTGTFQMYCKWYTQNLKKIMSVHMDSLLICKLSYPKFAIIKECFMKINYIWVLAFRKNINFNHEI